MTTLFTVIGLLAVTVVLVLMARNMKDALDFNEKVRSFKCCNDFNALVAMFSDIPMGRWGRGHSGERRMQILREVIGAVAGNIVGEIDDFAKLQTMYKLPNMFYAPQAAEIIRRRILEVLPDYLREVEESPDGFCQLSEMVAVGYAGGCLEHDWPLIMGQMTEILRAIIDRISDLPTLAHLLGRVRSTMDQVLIHNRIYKILENDDLPSLLVRYRLANARRNVPEISVLLERAIDLVQRIHDRKPSLATFLLLRREEMLLPRLYEDDNHNLLAGFAGITWRFLANEAKAEVETQAEISASTEGILAE